ncbi:MAG: hypothetical protein CRN43_06040 [Candidatus Nephrothrix sp. EaCA]|nr:MAG: hypothetical protein CRN43_06040 [Candidatus Nephrothrix sp. EaCA]
MVFPAQRRYISLTDLLFYSLSAAIAKPMKWNRTYLHSHGFFKCVAPSLVCVFLPHKYSRFLQIRTHLKSKIAFALGIAVSYFNLPFSAFGSKHVPGALPQILEDRYGKKSVIVASQLPIAKWHKYISEPTLADAIMDLLFAHAHRFELKGESLRKKSIRNTTQKTITLRHQVQPPKEGGE